MAPNDFFNGLLGSRMPARIETAASRPAADLRRARPGAARRAGERGIALLVLALALAFGVARLALWIAPGTVPGARGWLDVWPLALLGGALACGALGVVRRAQARAAALAGVAWALGVLVITDLPPAMTSHTLGDGPWLVPLYAAAALGAAAYVLAGRRPHGPAAHGARGVALIVLFTAANGRLWSRDVELYAPLLLAAALCGWTAYERRYSALDLARGPARGVALCAAAFVAWLLLAAVCGEAPLRGIQIWTRPLAGLLIAWTIAGAPASARVARRGFAALYAGVLIALALQVAGVLEASRVLGLAWLVPTRLRLFDLHPGLIAPFLAVGVCVAAARAAAARRPAGAALAILVALAAAAALARNGARASLLGAGVGLGVLALGLARAVPRRPGRAAAIAIAAALAAVAVLLSPLAAGLRADLDARSETASALGQRWHYWRMAAEATARDPILGHGLLTEYARTDLARPSSIDGGEQDLHAHDLPLALAEAAGLPGLALFVALVLGALELGRRAVLAAPDRAARARAAGITAALAAHLAANLLSMGQTRTTIVPLFLWVAIGLLAAELGWRPPAPRPRARPARAAVALALLLAFCVSPLAGRLARERGRAALARGDAERALALFDVALAVDPLERETHLDAAKALGALGDAQGRLEHVRAASAAAPRRDVLRFTLGQALLAAGRAEEAERELARAFALNPRGRAAGDFLAAWAGAELRLGDLDAAREHLLEALRRDGTLWRSLPRIALPAEPGDPPGAARLAFVAGDPSAPEGALPLSDVLARLEAEVDAALAREPPDASAARHLLGPIVDAYRAQGLVREPLALVERFAARVPERYSGVDTLYVGLLAAAGRPSEAAEVARAGGGRRAHLPDQELLREYADVVRSGGADAELWASAQALVPRVGMLDRDDVWFQRGRAGAIHGFLAELALRRGELERALDHHARERFDRATPEERAGAAVAFLGALVRAGATDAEIAAQAGRFAREASLSARLIDDDRALDPVVELLGAAWSDRDAAAALAQLSAAVRGSGRLGPRLVARLRAALG